MQKTRVILSTFGPLHLIKSAEYLAPIVNIKVIQGWIPKWYNRFIIKIASKVIGRDLSKSFMKRTPACLEGRNYSCAWPEFYLVGTRKFNNNNPQQTPVIAANLFGKASRHYIKDADIFHVRSGSGRGGAIAQAKAKGIKIIVDHSIAHPAFMDQNLREEYTRNKQCFDLGLDSPFWKEVLKDCEEADVLLVNSFFVRDTFVEQGYDPSKIKIAYLGVRKDFVALKKDWTINDTIKILFTGSFGFRKGGEYLLRAMQKLDEKRIKYEVIVVGSYEGASTIINKHKPKHIKFIGHIPQEELKTYLSQSDIYLFPSLAEGCASSGMEAMASGLPVIATIESGLPIDNNIDGIIIPSKSTIAIVDAILHLSHDAPKREKIGKNASAKIGTKYTWENYAKEVTDIYQEMLNSK